VEIWVSHSIMGGMPDGLGLGFLVVKKDGESSFHITRGVANITVSLTFVR